MNKWQVPLADIDLGPDEEAAVLEVLRSGWLTMGPKTEEFESRFAAHHRVDQAVALSNCTAALHLAYAALGLGAGDEVIMPSLTFVATANAAVACGARPVFADIISENEPTIDPEHVRSLITSRTRAITVVHYAGYPCRMDEIMRLADQHGLPVIEDCAHAPGVPYGSQYLGGVGAIGCFSFFSNKNMTTGEGGMALTRDSGLAGKMRLLRSHGMTSGTWKRHNERPQGYDVVEAGWNYRIDEIRSAIGLVQLAKLNESNRKRAELTALYHEQLARDASGQPAFQNFDGQSSHHILPFVAASSDERQKVVERLTKAGVQTSHHYAPIHQFKLYRERFGNAVESLPTTSSFSSREITLPLYSTMTGEQVEFVTSVIKNEIHGARGRAGGVE